MVHHVKKNSGQTDGNFFVRLSVRQKKKKKKKKIQDRQTDIFSSVCLSVKKKKKNSGQTDGHFFVCFDIVTSRSCYVAILLRHPNVVIVIAPPTGQCENEEWPIGPKILSHYQRPDLNRCHIIIKSVPLSKSSQSALSLKAASHSLSLFPTLIMSLWNRQQARHPFEITRHKEFPAFLVFSTNPVIDLLVYCAMYLIYNIHVTRH